MWARTALLLAALAAAALPGASAAPWRPESLSGCGCLTPCSAPVLGLSVCATDGSCWLPLDACGAWPAGCDAADVGNGRCEPECFAAATGWDAGDCPTADWFLESWSLCDRRGLAKERLVWCADVYTEEAVDARLCARNVRPDVSQSCNSAAARQHRQLGHDYVDYTYPDNYPDMYPDYMYPDDMYPDDGNATNATEPAPIVVFSTMKLEGYTLDTFDFQAQQIFIDSIALAADVPPDYVVLVDISTAAASSSRRRTLLNIAAIDVTFQINTVSELQAMRVGSALTSALSDDSLYYSMKSAGLSSLVSVATEGDGGIEVGSADEAPLAEKQEELTLIEEGPAAALVKAGGVNPGLIAGAVVLGALGIGICIGTFVGMRFTAAALSKDEAGDEKTTDYDQVAPPAAVGYPADAPPPPAPQPLYGYAPGAAGPSAYPSAYPAPVAAPQYPSAYPSATPPPQYASATPPLQYASAVEMAPAVTSAPPPMEAAPSP